MHSPLYSSYCSHYTHFENFYPFSVPLLYAASARLLWYSGPPHRERGGNSFALSGSRSHSSGGDIMGRVTVSLQPRQSLFMLAWSLPVSSWLLLCSSFPEAAGRRPGGWQRVTSFWGLGTGISSGPAGIEVEKPSATPALHTQTNSQLHTQSQFKWYWIW